MIMLSKGLTDDESTLGQVMGRYRQTTSNYGVGGAVRFLVVGNIGKEERPPWGQLWIKQYLTLPKYWPI